MKKLISLIFILSISLINAQSLKLQNSFFKLSYGIYGGFNFCPSSTLGTTLNLELKASLIENLNGKLSVGYSVINKIVGYNVNTYRLISIGDYKKYQAYSYAVNKVIYDVFPISIGIDYTFIQSDLSPYLMFELGYNYFSYHSDITPNKIGAMDYNSYDELPQLYKKDIPSISPKDSYKVGLGIGTNFRLTKKLYLDLRYMYQINTDLMNTNQIIIGIYI